MARGGRGRSGPKRGPLARLNPSPQVYYGDPIGVASGADYIWGTHAAATFSAEALKSRVFASVAAAVVTAVPALIVAPQQAYADVNQSSVFDPLSGRQGPTVRAFVGGPLQVDLTQQGWIAAPLAARQGPVPPIRQGAPQVADLTQQADLYSPLTTQQGRVPPFTLGDAQDDPTQLAARLTPSQPAAPITPNPIAGFFSVSPQTEERPTRAVWPSQLAGKTPALIALTKGGPQLYDFTQQAVLTSPSFTPVAVSYSIRSWYAAPQLADLTQQGWVCGTAPGRQAKVPTTIWATQADPSQLAPQVFTLRPLVFGRVPALFRGGQPQFNPYQIPAALGTPLEFGLVSDPRGYITPSDRAAGAVTASDALLASATASDAAATTITPGDS